MTPDYTHLLDADVLAYIDRCASFRPEGAGEVSIADQRKYYDSMCAALHRGRPAGVGVVDRQFDGVACRVYEAGPSAATVIYLHGGGFVVGGLDSHDDVCAELCDRTRYRVVAVDYGLAPEHVFPACFDDAWAAFDAISRAFDGPLVLAGDSAGATLAASVSHHARGRGIRPINGQVLIYPSLGGDMSQGSFVTHANAPMLTTADMKTYLRLRLGGAPMPQGDPRFAPLQDASFAGLPPTVVFCAECDPLCSDGPAYRDALLAAGTLALCIEEPGLVHAYLRARTMSSKAARSFDRIVRSVGDLGQGVWPVSVSSPLA